MESHSQSLVGTQEFPGTARGASEIQPSVLTDSGNLRLHSKQSKKKFLQSDPGDGTRATEQYIHGYKLALTLASVVVSLFIVALDQTIIATILTDISDEFGSFSKIGWLTSGYLLPMACLVPLYGKLSIAFGRKRTLATGIVVFEIGSLISALSQNMGMLIGGRVVQGLGGGGIQSMVIVILSESVPINKRPLSMALIGITFSVASVSGPFMGGALATHVTWRWCFYINLPLGGLALGLLVVAFHPPKPEGSLRAKLAKIDYIGTFLVSAGVVLVLLGMTFGGNEFAWDSAAVICCFVLGGLAICAFTYYNFSMSKNPLIVKEVVAVPQITAACLSATFNFCFFMGIITYLAIYFQVIFHASAWKSGVYLLPFIISVSLASAFNGIFMRYTRYVKVTMMISAVLGPIGTGLLLLLGKNTGVAARVCLLIPAGVSVGLQFQSSLLAAQLKAPGDIPGSMILASIFLSFTKTLGGVLGVVTSQLMLVNRGKVYLATAFAESPELSAIPVKSLLQSPEVVWSLPSEARETVLDAFMRALKDVFYLNLAYACLALVFAVFTTNERIPTKNQIRHSDDKPDLESTEDSPENKSLASPSTSAS